MEIYERIIELRKEHLPKIENKKISQTEFGEKIGVSRSVIKNLELGIVETKEHIIKLICQTFSVNEEWLRNGTEPVFKEKNNDNYINELVKKYNINSDEISVIKRFTNLDENSRNKIINFIFEILKKNIDKIDENKILQFSNIEQEKTKIVARGKGITYEDKSKIDEIIENSEDLNLDDIDFL